MIHRLLSLILFLTFLAVETGCTIVGPDFRRPDTAIQVPHSFQHAPKETVPSCPTDQWWRAFRDPELDQLVEEVLKNNLDIKKVAARILEIRSQLVQTKAERFPSLSFQGRAQRQRQTIELAMLTPQGIIQQQRRTTIDTHSLSLPASFELDLWGRLARAEEAVLADLLQAEENRRIAAQSVVAETINLYLQTEALERRLQIAQQSIESYRRSLALVESRYKRGLTTILDVRQARRMLVRAEAFLPTLRQDLGSTQQKLAVLLGRYPKTKAPRAQPEDYFTRLAPVPPGLPSDLLLRRPDIRAAEARLRALNALVGVAKASRFPQITLTGNLGYSSEELNELFTPQSEWWSLAMGIVQPIFNAGRLKAGQRAAEARYEQGVVEYAKAVLTAFSEAENALLTRREQLERRDRVMSFVSEARATQHVAEGRYKRGLVDYLAVLEAQQTRFQAEENLVQVDLALLTNRVSLHRALGGGWAVAEQANSVRPKKLGVPLSH